MNQDTQGQPPVDKNSTNELSTRSGEMVHASQRRGPRTATGKRNSSANARKHALLSKVIVIKGELQVEFDSLLKGLCEDFQPEGSLEYVLVEMLAALLWRYRRLIIAEGAEIQKGARFLKWDEKERKHMEARECIHKTPTKLFEFNNQEERIILMDRISNPEILKRCLDSLKELKDEIEQNGFNKEFEEQLLTKLYGDAEHWVETLVESYQVWSRIAECSAKERAQFGYAAVEQCIKNFLEKLEAEIARLEKYAMASAYLESERMKLEALRRNVPNTPELDRLVRYETSLQRAIDRTLIQLERHQRMRLGQPVPPPLKVDLTGT